MEQINSYINKVFVGQDEVLESVLAAIDEKRHAADFGLASVWKTADDACGDDGGRKSVGNWRARRL